MDETADARATLLAMLETGALFRLLVETVVDYAIFALDTTGCVVSWNPGAERFKGYRADEIIGRHFSAFFTPEDVAAGRPQRELETAAREGHAEDEGWRVRRDGSRFWANVVITALRDDEGRLIGFVKVTRDLTERRAAEERARDSDRRAAASEAANRAKSEFLATMSHELRTPLNAIGGYAELLADGVAGPMSEQQRNYVERIRASQRHLLLVINDILNLSRVEVGQLAYETAPVPLGEVVEVVLPMIAPQAAAKRIAIHRAAACAGVALADRAKVEQVLLNLLSNAVKYTGEGGHVELACGERGAMVCLHVRDDGVGIAPAEQERIFEPFVQVGRTLSSTHEGVGLGLAISRDLARGMGGDLTVESAPGRGSTFTLALPKG